MIIGTLGHFGLFDSLSQILADNTLFIFIFSEPYAEYKIWIKAYTVKNEGKSSEPIVVLTDVRAPGAPIVVNLTCQNGNTLFVFYSINTKTTVMHLKQERISFREALVNQTRIV